MGYAHIENLYKNQQVLLFKELWALEKIHGTSAHITWDGTKITAFSGGEKSENFVALFDFTALQAKFLELFGAECQPVTVYGEAYGGKQQGMKATYGDKLRFTAFEVAHGKDEQRFENVDRAAATCAALGIEFVPYRKIPATLDAIDAERDAPSIQAQRIGCTGPDRYGFSPPIREGIVLRPPVELRLNNGGRIIAKHKRPEFSETKTPRAVDPSKAEIMAAADKIADEYVTPNRLDHVLQRLPEATGIEHTGLVIKAMVEDVMREGAGEIVDSKDARKAVGAAAARLWKQRVTMVPRGD